MSNTNAMSAINPFALAELVAQKRIDWDKYDDPVEALCGILNISRSDIFSANSPVLDPFTEISVDGTVRYLDDDKAKKRLETYLSQNMYRRITKKPPMRRLALKTIRSRLQDILLASKPIYPGDIDSPERIEEITELPEKPHIPHFPPNYQRPKPKIDKPWLPKGYTWMDMGEYFKEVPEYDDPIQGAVGDCYLIAALSAIAWTRPYVISNSVRPSELGNEDSPLHQYTFYEDGKATTMEVTEKVLMDTSGTNPQWKYARSGDLDLGETWPAVYEKAYAKLRAKTTTDCPNMNVLASGVATTACIHITNEIGTTCWHSQMNPNEIMEKIKQNCSGKKAKNPLFCLTPDSPPNNSDLDYPGYGIKFDHYYTILGWDERDDKQYVVLRNPWGYAEAIRDVLDGDWNFDGDETTPNIPYNKKGVFALLLETYHKYFVLTSFTKKDIPKG